MSQSDQVDRMMDELDRKKRAPEIASDCFAADGGQSDVKALAEDPKRSADRLRKIRELATEAKAHFAEGRTVSGQIILSNIRELCSHENSSPSDAA